MGKLLWTPSEAQIQDSNMYRFMAGVNRKYKTNFTTYPELWQWSVDNIAAFWAEDRKSVV